MEGENHGKQTHEAETQAAAPAQANHQAQQSLLSMGNVVVLDVVTTEDVPPERILNGAQDAGMTEVVVVGFDRNGQEYFASSVADGGSALWHLERAKLRLLRMPDDPDFLRTRAASPEGKVLPFSPDMPKQPA